ncbi:hypothetical protein ACLQ2R_19675 [Streptosporangium sp. DT93]
MTRWEYLVRESLTESELTTLGADGWELVSAIYHVNRMLTIHYLKRPGL